MGLEHLSSIFSVGIKKMHKSNVGSMYESGESNFSNIRDSFSLPDLISEDGTINSDVVFGPPVLDTLAQRFPI